MKSIPAWVTTPTDLIVHLGNVIEKQQAEIEALKAHPVKELTDEEIADLIYNKVTDSEMIKKALRKAQEK